MKSYATKLHNRLNGLEDKIACILFIACSVIGFILLARYVMEMSAFH